LDSRGAQEIRANGLPLLDGGFRRRLIILAVTTKLSDGSLPGNGKLTQFLKGVLAVGSPDEDGGSYYFINIPKS
jgi:hypothetical protein